MFSVDTVVFQAVSSWAGEGGRMSGDENEFTACDGEGWEKSWCGDAPVSSEFEISVPEY